MNLQQPSLALVLCVINFYLGRTPARGAPTQRYLRVPCGINEGEQDLLGCSRCCWSLEDEIEMDMRHVVQEVHLGAAESSLEVSSHGSNSTFFCFTESFSSDTAVFHARNPAIGEGSAFGGVGMSLRRGSHVGGSQGYESQGVSGVGHAPALRWQVTSKSLCCSRWQSSEALCGF